MNWKPRSQQEFTELQQELYGRTLQVTLFNANLRLEYKTWEHQHGPRFELLVYGPFGGGYGQHLTREMLEELHEMIGRFLQLPQPPVNVRVELVMPPAPPPRDVVLEREPRSAEEHQEAEKQAIKRRMLEGK